MPPRFARLLRARPRNFPYALALFALLLVFLLGAGFLIYRQLVERAERQTLQTLNEIADVQTEAVGAWIDERVSDAAAFANGNVLGETVHQWVRNGAPADAMRGSILQQLMAIKLGYDYVEVAIVAPDGTPYLSTEGPDSQSMMLSSSIAHATVRHAAVSNQPVFSTMHAGEGPGGRASVVDIAAPLLDMHLHSGKTRSLLLMRADASKQLEPFVTALPLVNTRTEAVLAEIIDGRVMSIASSSNAVHFATFGELPVDAHVLLAAARAQEELLLEEPRGPNSAGFPRGTSVGAVRHVRGTPWFLITLIDPDATYAHIRNLAWLVALIGGGILLLSGIALLFWARARESRYRLESFRSATEKALLQRHYDYLSRYANDVIILADRNGHMLEINDKTLHLLGRKREDLLGQPIESLFLPECRHVVQAALAELGTSGHTRFEVMQRDHGDRLLSFEGSGRALERGGEYIAQFIFRDISDRRAAEAALRQSQERVSTILASIHDIVWSISPDLQHVNYINQSIERLFGYTIDTFEAHPSLWLECIHPEDRAHCEQIFQALSPAHPHFDLEYRIISRDGVQRWLHCRGQLVVDEQDDAVRIDGVASDITERKAAERQVQMLAYYDGVTRLPNRTLLHDRLGQALPVAARTGRKVALLFMDLDNFKNINDSLGHQVGDQLLRAIADRLMQCVREEDTVARIGGDEFLIVLPDLDRPGQAVSVAEKVLAAAAQPFDLPENRVHSTISIGISIFPDDAADVQELIRHADSALYQAKGLGRNTYQFFTAELNYQITRQSDIERRLRHAIENGKLQLWYQPQIDARTGRLIGAEALTRWRQDDHDVLSPAEFIPVAEERGLISKIGEWALREACGQCRRWQTSGLQPVPIAVNVSPVQFQQKNFANLVIEILHETGLSGDLLELEITESTLMRSGTQVFQLTAPLREAGIRISIDDFGTGYSSLNYLRQLPIDKIKIDRSFVVDLPQDGAIARTIVQLAHSLQLRVIAEGVESQAQIDRLRTFGCDEVQGYYYSSAMSAEAFGDLLADRERFVSQGTGVVH